MNPFLRGLLDLFYPPRCEACGRLQREPLCADCRAQVDLIQPPLCQVCGDPFDPLARGSPTCAQCRGRRRWFSRARTAAYYWGPLRDAICRFKYDGQVVLARPLGRILADALDGGASDLAPGGLDVVCPVPLHPSRQKERGFNQSELLAEAVAAQIGAPLRSLLERTRPTAPQVDLPVATRAANVRGAFAPGAGEGISGVPVLLVDDLFTTGSTLSECARVLVRAGAADVTVLTLARPMPAWRTALGPAPDAPREARSG